MNIQLRFIERIQGWVKLELEQLAAAIKTGWEVEHAIDGTHTAITADSVTATDLSVTDLSVADDLTVGDDLDVTGTAEVGTLLHTDECWDDLVIPGVAVNPTGIPSAMTVITDTAGWLGCLLASSAGNPTAVFAFQLSHQTDLTRDLRPHIHWVKCDGADNTGTVPWRAYFRHLPLNGTATAWSSAVDGTLSLDPGDTANKGALTSWTLDAATYATGGAWGISDSILMRVERNGGTSGDAAVVSADIHYRKVRLGSPNEASL